MWGNVLAEELRKKVGLSADTKEIPQTLNEQTDIEFLVTLMSEFDTIRGNFIK